MVLDQLPCTLNDDFCHLYMNLKNFQKSCRLLFKLVRLLWPYDQESTRTNRFCFFFRGQLCRQRPRSPVVMKYDRNYSVQKRETKLNPCKHQRWKELSLGKPAAWDTAWHGDVTRSHPFITAVSRSSILQTDGRRHSDKPPHHENLSIFHKVSSFSHCCRMSVCVMCELLVHC